MQFAPKGDDMTKSLSIMIFIAVVAGILAYGAYTALTAVNSAMDRANQRIETVLPK